MMKKTTAKITTLILTLIFAGCSTTVTFQVQRPPALNTLGIRRLAVMPFTTTVDTSQSQNRQRDGRSAGNVPVSAANNPALHRQAATWLTNESLSRIQATNHFTLINAAEVERVQAANGNVEALADALFGGQVLSIGVQDSSQQGSYKDKEGDTIYYVTYTREVQLAFNYSLTRTRDGSMIGPINRNVSTSSSSQDDPSGLSSVDSMVQTLVQRSLAGLARDVAPYMAMEQRSLMKETSKDKVIKQRSKEAHAQVKTGNYKIAQKAFADIYHDTGSFAAAYNAALLIEVQGSREEAAAFLQGVYNDTGNPNAMSEIARLQRAMAEAGLLEAYAANQTQRDKVIALMVETLPSAMPNEPRIALINNSQNEKELADVVISGITDGFVKKNITVVDRNHQALIEMERNYQYSGNVSDEEMVSLGHETGVNAFVLVSVTGSGGSRRLSVRMLDIERNTILYQSPQTDEMNL